MQRDQTEAGSRRGDMIILQGASERVEALTFSLDGRLLAAPSQGAVQLWDIAAAGGRPARYLDAPATTAVEFTPAGRRLLAIRGGAARFYDFDQQQEVEIPLEGSGSWVQFGSLTPDGQAVLIATRIGASHDTRCVTSPVASGP
jgi:WD40 repeat protein